MNEYKLAEAARPILDFIDELSLGMCVGQRSFQR